MTVETRNVVRCTVCGVTMSAHQEASMAAHVRTVHRASPGLSVRMERPDGRAVRPTSCAACAGPVFTDEEKCRRCGLVNATYGQGRS